MAKSAVYKQGPAQMAVNMTPMIDCVFQLLIFFMLTTQMASKDFPNIELPRPAHPQVKDYKETSRAIVNVIPYSAAEIRKDESLMGMAMAYTIKGQVLNPEELVSALLNAQRTCQKPEEFVVEIRADKRVQYSEIEPVLQALKDAELSKMHITAMQKGQE